MVVTSFIETITTGSPFPLLWETLDIASGGKLKEWRNKRAKDAENTLLGELQRGEININVLIEQYPNDFFASVARYQKAVQDGVAISNLRLMAKIIRADFADINEEQINSDRNVYFQSIIAELSVAEMVLLVDLYNETKLELENASGRIGEKMVPSQYPTQSYLSAAFVRLIRTGLVQPELLMSGLGYHTSPLMDELVELVAITEWQECF